MISYSPGSDVVMLIGPASSQKIVQKGGVTVHRRSCKIRGFHIDLHIRVDDHDMSTSAFGDGDYCCRLGMALGEMQPHVFDDFIGVYIRSAVGDEYARIARTSIFYEFPGDLTLFKSMLECDLSQLMRNMMSE